MKQELSILIPVFNSDCRLMVQQLSRQAQLLSDRLTYEIIVADDGSTDRQSVTANITAFEAIPHCRFIDRQKNVGRAAIRNFLAQTARYEWLLFIDGDMAIIRDNYLADYLDTDDAQVVYGGYQVEPGENGNLRYRYEMAAAHMHTAEERQKRPYQHFHTANFMVCRTVMTAHPFDERFRTYGYEDVLFGKTLRQDHIAITHTDNTVGFCRYESNDRFVSKTEEGLRTLHTFRSDLRGYSNLLTFVEGIHLPVVRGIIKTWHMLFGKLERRNLCGRHPSLKLLKLYKTGYYLSLKNQ